jgi:hypothetical protein
MFIFKLRVLGVQVKAVQFVRMLGTTHPTM